jgi:hypothetical protein
MRCAPLMDKAVKGYTHVDWLLLWSGDSLICRLHALVSTLHTFIH